MNSHIENDLRQYHEQFTQEHNRLREEILAQLPFLKQIAQPAITVRKKRLMRSFLGLATGITAALVIWLAFFSGPQTLSAQVMEAFKKAQSVHLVRKIWKDGNWTPSGEVWYQNSSGVREEIHRKNQKIIRIDNGTYQWRFDSAAKLAVRLKSSNPLGLAAEAINPGKILNRCKRDPSGDATIQGRPCLHFSAMNDKQTVRIMIWMDNDNRLLRYKELNLKDGQWIDDEWIDVEYDLPIDIALFEPKFGEGIQIVESDKFLNERFNPKKAIYSKEIEGHILSLHQLHRINDRMFFLVYSTQPTQDILKRYGMPSGSMSYADFNLYTPGKRVGENKWQNYQDVSLATFHLEGMEIHWDLVLLQGEWPEKIDSFDFGGRFYTRGPLQNDLTAYQDFNPLVSMPISEKSISLDDAIATVHQETSLCQPLAFQISLHLMPRPLSEKEIQEHIKSGMPEAEARRLSSLPNVSPKEITPEEFGNAIKEYLAKLGAQTK